MPTPEIKMKYRLLPAALLIPVIRLALRTGIQS